MSSSINVPIDTDRISENDRKIAFATIIGTTVEWYDFFIYAAAAGLIFTNLFFHHSCSYEK